MTAGHDGGSGARLRVRAAIRSALAGSSSQADRVAITHSRAATALGSAGWPRRPTHSSQGPMSATTATPSMSFQAPASTPFHASRHRQPLAIDLVAADDGVMATGDPAEAGAVAAHGPAF